MLIYKHQVKILENRWKEMRIQLAMEHLKPGIKSNKLKHEAKLAMEAYFDLAMKYDVQLNNQEALRKLKNQPTSLIRS